MMLVVSAFLLGALGAAHCVTMCGGFAALGAPAPVDVTSNKLVRARANVGGILLAQNLGRVTAYAGFGLVAGGLGATLGENVRFGQAALEVFSSMLLLGAGLFLVGLLPSFALLERAGAPLFRELSPHARRLLPLRTPAQAALFGAAWGFLPCGLVYSALALASTSGTALQGGLVMFAFGAGTLPALLAMGVLADSVRALAKRGAVRRVAGVALVAFAVIHLSVAADRLSGTATCCAAK